MDWYPRLPASASSTSLNVVRRTCSDYETLGTMQVKLGGDDRDTIGMGCFSVLYRLHVFFAARVCGFMNRGSYNVTLHLI